MDPRTPQGTPAPQTPTRRVYFGAADKQHLATKQISGGPDLQTIEISRRQKLAMTLTQRAEDVAAAVKTLRAFDATGNTGGAIAHLQATVADLNRAHEQLAADVEASLARYHDRRENEQILTESTTGRGVLINHGSIEAERAAFLEANRNGRGPGWELTETAAARVEAHLEAGSWPQVRDLIDAKPAPKPGPR